MTSSTTRTLLPSPAFAGRQAVIRQLLTLRPPIHACCMMSAHLHIEPRSTVIEYAINGDLHLTVLSIYMLHKSLFIYTIALFAMLFISCKQQRPSKPSVTNKPAPILPTMTYGQTKQNVAALKTRSAAQWRQMSSLNKSKLFTQVMADSILPHWLGTPWNFYGTTETPNKGTIACGYFVTTTLRDAGFPLQRTKLAQCASEQMITTLIQAAYIKRYRNTPFATFLDSMKQQGYGLYLIGLDSHTGFLYHDGKTLYFIHASYVGQRTVVKEIADNAVILAASRYRITGKISADEGALKKWVLDT